MDLNERVNTRTHKTSERTHVAPTDYDSERAFNRNTGIVNRISAPPYRNTNLSNRNMSHPTETSALSNRNIYPPYHNISPVTAENISTLHAVQPKPPASPPPPSPLIPSPSPTTITDHYRHQHQHHQHFISPRADIPPLIVTLSHNPPRPA